MNITPLGNRVLVKFEKPDDKTVSGIVLTAASVNPNYFNGVITALGPEVKYAIKIGDKISFLKYGYEDMGNDIYLVEEQSLLAIHD